MGMEREEDSYTHNGIRLPLDVDEMQVELFRGAHDGYPERAFDGMRWDAAVEVHKDWHVQVLDDVSLVRVWYRKQVSWVIHVTEPDNEWRDCLWQDKRVRLALDDILKYSTVQDGGVLSKAMHGSPAMAAAVLATGACGRWMRELAESLNGHRQRVPGRDPEIDELVADVHGLLDTEAFWLPLHMRNYAGALRAAARAVRTLAPVQSEHLHSRSRQCVAFGELESLATYVRNSDQYIANIFRARVKQGKDSFGACATGLTKWDILATIADAGAMPRVSVFDKDPLDRIETDRAYE